MLPKTIPSDRLTPADVPSSAEGWSQRAIEFAHTFDGYAFVGGGPAELWERMAAVFSFFSEARELPALSLDELRALVFYLARSDRHAGGYGLEACRHERVEVADLEVPVLPRFVRPATGANPSAVTPRAASEWAYGR